MDFSGFSDISGAVWLLFAIVLGSILFLLFMTFYTWRKNLLLEKKLADFFQGKNGANLEKVLLDQIHEIKELDKEIQELFEISNKIHQLAAKSIHKVELLRFNPFKEVGSNQSFSLALLDSKNTGLILSSLHTREGSRIYAKPVKHGKEDGYPFTEEEKQSIVIASNQYKEFSI